MLLDVDGLGKDFGQGAIVENVSFSLDRGQSLAIVAPSGAGKSTLLSMLGLLMQPTEGLICIDGTDTAKLSDAKRSYLRTQKIGFMFQHTQLIGSLRAVENVLLPGDFVHNLGHRMKNSDALAHAEEMLSAMGLSDRLYYYPRQLSVGQKRRIATARALFLDPSLIIADEPTNDLDPENAAIVVDTLFKRVDTGEAALIYATHDRNLATRADTMLDLGTLSQSSRQHPADIQARTITNSTK